MPGRALDDLLMKNNHRDITCPADRDASNYKLIRRFILGRDTALTVAGSVAVGDPLFAIYRPQHEPFYIHRPIDRIVNQALLTGHCWIAGVSGAGKTVSATRSAMVDGATLYQVYLGSYQSTPPDGMLDAIYVELADRFGATPASSASRDMAETIGAIRVLLRKHPSHQRVCLLIEELPLKSERDFLDFALQIEALIESLNAGGMDNVRVIVTSIPDFSVQLRQSSDKLAAAMQFLTMTLWDEPSMLSLVSTVEGALSLPDQSPHLEQLLKASAGRPRVVKEVYRKLRNTPDDRETMLDVLANLGLRDNA
jgi:hypothetical protein